VLAAEKFGKHKTISQIVAIIALLVTDACREWTPQLRDVFAPWVGTFAGIALWLTVALTATSGLIYLWRNRSIYLSEI
jgi:phosphatidylglycerophosphate synthase